MVTLYTIDCAFGKRIGFESRHKAGNSSTQQRRFRFDQAITEESSTAGFRRLSAWSTVTQDI